VAVEFVYVAAMLDHLSEAARVLGYLDGTGSWGVLVRSTVLADVVDRVDSVAEPAHGADPRGTQPADRGGLDGREALTFMRAVLDDLLTEATAPTSAEAGSDPGGMP